MSVAGHPLSEQVPAKLPKRVWAGVLGLYATVLLALLSGLVLGGRPVGLIEVVGLTTIVALVIGALFVALLGAGSDARDLIPSVTVALVLSLAVALALQWGMRHDAAHADTSGLSMPWNWVDHLQRQAREATHFAPALSGQILGVALFEETIKLLPAGFLLLTGRVRSVRSLMLCAAICALIFGMTEAMTYATLVYPREGAIAWTSIVRAGVAAPSHALWSAVGIAVACVLVGRSCSPRLALLGGWSLACLMHGFHNAAQSSFGPVMQIPSTFTAMLLFFLMVRWAWRVDAMTEV